MNYVYEHKVFGDIDINATTKKKMSTIEEVTAFAILFIDLEERHCVVSFDKDVNKPLNQSAITRRMNKAIKEKFESCIKNNTK